MMGELFRASEAALFEDNIHFISSMPKCKRKIFFLMFIPLTCAQIHPGKLISSLRKVERKAHELLSQLAIEIKVNSEKNLANLLELLSGKNNNTKINLI